MEEDNLGQTGKREEEEFFTVIQQSTYIVYFHKIYGIWK